MSAPTVKVRMLQSCPPWGGGDVGAVVDMSKADAKAWCDGVRAELVDPPQRRRDAEAGVERTATV